MIPRPLALALLSLTAAACGNASVSRLTRAVVQRIVELATVRQDVAGNPVVYLFTAPGCASSADQAGALARRHSGQTLALPGRR